MTFLFYLYGILVGRQDLVALSAKDQIRSVWLHRCLRSINTQLNGKAGSIENSIKEKLQKHFSPIHLEIHNESPMHNVGQLSETHFRLLVVSPAFDKVSMVKRHRMINKVLEYELEHGIHALSIDAKSAEQWNKDTMARADS